jgi:hypothetical protein
VRDLPPHSHQLHFHFFSTLKAFYRVMSVLNVLKNRQQSERWKENMMMMMVNTVTNKHTKPSFVEYFFHFS